MDLEPRPRRQSHFANLVKKPMAQRGRKSSASLGIVSVLGNERPARDELTDFHREVWQRAVASETSTVPASERYL
jgi:hypothetical protein